MPTWLIADLDFEVRTPESDQPVGGRIRGDGELITIEVSRAPRVVSVGGRRQARELADLLDRHGLTVRLKSPSGWIFAAGHWVRAPWWQLPFTGTRRLRLGSVRALIAGARGPRIFDAAL